MLKIKIDIDDVRKHRTVEAAIHAQCGEDSDHAAGVVGSSFSTSGPGPGWSRTHDECDFARRALSEGAQGYIDATDGRVATLEEADEDDDTQDCITDGSGDPTLYHIVWSEGSEIELVCPSEADALDNPAALAEMAKNLEVHAKKSDIKAWKKLIASIRETSEALDDIDIE